MRQKTCQKNINIWHAGTPTITETATIWAMYLMNTTSQIFNTEPQVWAENQVTTSLVFILYKGFNYHAWCCWFHQDWMDWNQRLHSLLTHLGRTGQKRTSECKELWEIEWTKKTEAGWGMGKDYFVELIYSAICFIFHLPKTELFLVKNILFGRKQWQKDEQNK